MGDTPRLGENLCTFRQHFDSRRADLCIPVSPDSVKSVFSVINITDAKNLIIDLIRILVSQNQPNIRSIPSQNHHANHLANLFSIGSSVFTDSFDIRLAIPLVEQIVNEEPDEKIHRAVFELAAHVIVTSPISSLKVASDTQTSASSKATESNPSRSDDNPEFRAQKRARLTYWDSKCEEDRSGLGRRDGEPALEKSSTFQYQPLNTARREIRLLVLHPSEDIFNSLSYSCSLIHISMDENPDYEALS
ncbi:hypothetical protein DL98DRAFT_635853, partial [Cadophora sp. DSE1049]